MTSIRNHSRITEISPWNRSKALKTPPTIVSEFVSSILSEIPPKISLDFFSMIALAISESLFHELLEGFLLEFLHKIFQESPPRDLPFTCLELLQRCFNDFLQGWLY